MFLKLIGSLTLICATSMSLFASDHEDGPALTPKSDIVDFYTFTAYEQKKLVLIMTVESQAEEDARLDPNIEYKFRLKPVQVAVQGSGEQKQWKIETSAEETTVSCKAGIPNTNQSITCKVVAKSCGDDCPSATTSFNQLDKSNSDEQFKIYTGNVKDPFFSDVFRVRKRRPRNRQARFAAPAINVFKKKSTMGIVVELPISILGGNRKFGVVAETFEIDSHEQTHGHSHGKRVDRMGNVEVTNFILCFRPITKAGIDLPKIRPVAFNCPASDLYIKDWYNQDDAFALTESHADSYKEFFKRGLTLLDGMDSKFKAPYDWSNESNPFIKLLTYSDYLIVDTSKTCIGKKNTYLDVQMSVYFGVENQSCGGRLPNDDTIDILQTVLINGPNRLPEGLWQSEKNGVWREDGVTEAGSQSPLSFPWLQQLVP
jgi:hypothetical protein